MITNKPQIMGVLNVTPDSFYDGNKYYSLDSALNHAKQLIADGADILDIGGESTRPGAKTISVQEELDRVIPVIEKIAKDYPITISIDSSKPEVMALAIENGATIINDVNALQAQDALQVAAKYQVKVCLMHMQNNPQTMQTLPSYSNVVLDIANFLQARITACENMAIKRENIIIDPGFGFGKTVAHNLTLLKNLNFFKIFNLPILIGLSRKSMFGEITGKAANDRLAPSLAAHLLGVQNGASIVRTHDVAKTKDALVTYSRVLQGE